MIVSRVEGNLISLAKEGKYSAIVHGCNAFHTMGSGIAPQIAKQWPEAQEVDNATVYGSVEKLGSFSHCYDKKLKMFVINGYTQHSTSNTAVMVSYPAIAKLFTKLNASKKLQTLSKGRPVGIPMIGAGKARGHWEAIEVIINLVTPDLNIELVRYKP